MKAKRETLDMWVDPDPPPLRQQWPLFLVALAPFLIVYALGTFYPAEGRHRPFETPILEEYLPPGSRHVPGTCGGGAKSTYEYRFGCQFTIPWPGGDRVQWLRETLQERGWTPAPDPRFWWGSQWSQAALEGRGLLFCRGNEALAFVLFDDPARPVLAARQPVNPTCERLARVASRAPATEGEAKQ